MNEEPNQPAALRVLFIEDNPVDVAILRQVFDQLTSDFSVVLDHAPTLRAGLDRLAQSPADVVFIDLGLPDCCGLSGLKTLRESHPQLPVIVLTSQDASGAILDAIRSGAQDYFVKHRLNANHVRDTLKRLLSLIRPSYVKRARAPE